MTAPGPMQIRIYIEGELSMSARVTSRETLAHVRAEMLTLIASRPGARWCIEVHNPVWDADAAVRMGTDTTPMLEPHPANVDDLLAIALPALYPPDFRPCFVDADRSWFPDEVDAP
jgi:hypothetical protein